MQRNLTDLSVAGDSVKGIQIEPDIRVDHSEQIIGFYNCLSGVRVTCRRENMDLIFDQVCHP